MDDIRQNAVLVVVVFFLGPFDEEQLRQDTDDEILNPWRQLVGHRRPKVNVEHGYRGDDGQGAQQHGKQQILSEQRHSNGSRRNDLHQQQEEHG